MVYESKITANTTYREYFETSEGEFKSIYNKQKQSRKYISQINDTELSKYLWMGLITI